MPLLLINNWKLIVAALLLAGSAGLGWIGRGYVEDSQDLAELRGAEKAIQAAMARESKIAGALETKLQELKANEKVIEREKIKIIDRPIYSVSCLDPSGVQLINAAKDGTDPAKPAD